jgi:hypothetical protein
VELLARRGLPTRGERELAARLTWNFLLDAVFRLVVSVSWPPGCSRAVPLIEVVTEWLVAARAVPVMATAAAVAMDVLRSLMRAA